MIRREVASGRGGELGARLPQLVYVAIAPFLGPEQAAAELERKIAREAASGEAAAAA